MKQKICTIKSFNRKFPDEVTCLEWFWTFRYPEGAHCSKCEKLTIHHKLSGRDCFACDFRGRQVNPKLGTIYERSSTPLRLWFLMIFLMISNPGGLTIKQLGRGLGVTYKTAQRMSYRIRVMLSQDPAVISGRLQLDEKYFGGVCQSKKELENSK
jgi:transposase-like protein